MLIYDFFKSHFEKPVKRKFHKIGFDFIVISSKLTSIYQLLNIAINKLFKNNFHKE